MSLSEMLVSDVSDLLLNTSDFAESVERHRDSEPVPVALTALVTWAVPEDRSDKGKEAPVKVGDDGCDTMRYVVAEVDLGARPGIRWI